MQTLRLFLLILLPLWAFPQELTVYDQLTRQPLPLVLVYNDSLSLTLTTDKNGQNSSLLEYSL